MKKNNPKVSFLIPLYNAEKYIAETLDSVLAQTYQNFEVIIVDDGSVDGSLAIVQKYKDSRIKLFCNDKNRGIAYTRNCALSYCKGTYIALLDDDDLALNTRLEKQIDFLENHPDIDAVGGNAQWIDENGKIIRDTIEVISEPDSIRMFFLFRNILNNSEMTFRRCVVEKNQLKYQDECFGLEDFLFWIQFSKVAKISNISDLVLQKRVSYQNETGRMRSEKSNERRYKYLEMQKYSLLMDRFVLEQEDEQILLDYFSEESRICKNERELLRLADFLKRMACQAGVLQLPIYVPLKKWFENILNWNLENIKIDFLENWKKSIMTAKEGLITRKEYGSLEEKWYTKELFSLICMNRQFYEKEKYIQELIDSKEWLKQHSREQEKCIQELIKGKEWLEQHDKDQEKYIQELIKGKEWLEQHSEDQERYIQELIKGKEWLEWHSKEMDVYMQKLIKKSSIN